MNKKTNTKTRLNRLAKRLSKLLNGHKKLIIWVVILLLFLCAGYGILLRFQKEKYIQQRQVAEAQQQLKALSDEVSQLKQERQSQSSRLEQEIAKPATKTTPSSASTIVSAVKQTSGCTQSKIDAFRNMALSQGYTSEEVEAFIAAAKANGCKTPDPIDEMNSKLDQIQNCQKYGICY